MSKIHLIAIGGSIMHNLAITLKKQGHEISGSDDQIFEPAKSRLANAGILPATEGWNADRITGDLDLVILGMHAKKDNPELLKAQQLKIQIQSFPEFIGKQFNKKKQIMVIGSHGKTTTTAMLIHVFQHCGVPADFLVGAQLDGFQEMVTITNAPFAIIEGDEYLSSCLDPIPKFSYYDPFITIITGIAWDHYNVFPTYDSYIAAFRNRILSIPENHHVIYYQGDSELSKIILETGAHLKLYPYLEAPSTMNENQTELIIADQRYPLEIFGSHNLQNLQAVLDVSTILGLNLHLVAQALSTFKGAAKRMELISRNERQIRYRDFAHAPSKVKATLNAFKQKYPNRRMLVILELHTYSSLNRDFLPQYAGTTTEADLLILYFDKKAMEIKNMPELNPQFLLSVFQNPSVIIIDDAFMLEEAFKLHEINHELVVFLGSGHFGGLNLVDSSSFSTKG